jgi:heme oxygenase
MSILREYTNEKHRQAEDTPFVQYMLHGSITPEDYAEYLQQMEHVYSNIEYFAELSGLTQDMPDLKRAEYMREDLKELGCTTTTDMLPSIARWRQRIVDLYHGDKKDQIMAHIYVRHMGDMYGGKVIAKRVPGSGKCYEFVDRPALIKVLDSKLSMDILDEALLAFDLAIDFFNELQEKIDERRKTNGS